MYNLLVKDELKSTSRRIDGAIKCLAEVLAEYVGTENEYAARCSFESMIEAKRCAYLASQDFEILNKLVEEQ